MNRNTLRRHARQQKRIPIWDHLCQDCGTPINVAGICASCAEVRGDVQEITRVLPVIVSTGLNPRGWGEV
jgi:hypothetical protein